MIPRSIEKLFDELGGRAASKEVGLVCSFMEIYNDAIRDLGKAYVLSLDSDHAQTMADKTKTSDIFHAIAGRRGNPYFAPAFHKELIAKKKGAKEIHDARSAQANDEMGKRPGLKEASEEYKSMNYEIREDGEGNVFVKDLAMVPIGNLKEAMDMIKLGTELRATHETSMNANSSRSHTVFSISVIQRDKETDETTVGCLNLIDLAGSERLKKTESTGVRLKEALHINTSLTALSKVIMSLDPQSEGNHVPFRDAKLTRVLQNSLGGNSFTAVLAAIHPHPSHYEECLSTLQFANRCRNVRNNPKVNYLSTDEDKDRKIKRLQEEVKKLEGKMGEGGHGGHGGHGHHHTPMTATNVASMLKKLGIQAETDSSGALIVNGKKMAAAELGLDEGSSSTDLGSGGSMVSGGGGAGGGGGGGGGGGFTASAMKGMNPEKMRRIVTELKDDNSKLSVKVKEQKSTLEEQGRMIQDKDGEIVKLQTTLKHRDWEYKELYEEKDRELGAQQLALKEKFNIEMQTLVANNKDILLKQQSVIQSVPDTFRNYTTLLKKADTAREKFDVPIRKEFEKHLKNLEESREMVMANVKSQYEYWLKEKDRVLQDFVVKFNSYRSKKSEHLRQCEKEIVHLHEYTEQLEKILDGVEKGKYLVQQKQGSTGRSSTEGMSGRAASAGGNGGRPGSMGGAGDMPQEGAGAVVIPKGLRPTNPMRLPDNKHLDLTKRIVAKHKERMEKLEKIKEEAFHKSLHHASLSGTVTAEVDPVLQKQIRDLLVTPSTAKSRKANSTSSGGAKRGESKKGDSAGGGAAEEKNDGDKKSQQQPATDSAAFPAIDGNPKLIPTSWGASPPLEQTSKAGDSLAPGPPPAASASAARTAAMNQVGSVANSMGNTRASFMSRENSEMNLLRAEVAELKAARKLDAVNATKVVEELAGNETIQYIRYLESEQERLHKMIRDISTQLHSAKVANNALNRKTTMGPTATASAHK
jgi:hypothetical protein